MLFHSLAVKFGVSAALLRMQAAQRALTRPYQRPRPASRVPKIQRRQLVGVHTPEPSGGQRGEQLRYRRPGVVSGALFAVRHQPLPQLPREVIHMLRIRRGDFVAELRQFGKRPWKVIAQLPGVQCAYRQLHHRQIVDALYQPPSLKQVRFEDNVRRDGSFLQVVG